VTVEAGRHMRASQGLGRLWVINRKAHCEPFWSAFGWRIVDQWRHSHPAPERRLSLVEAIGHAAARAVRGTHGTIRPRPLLRPLWSAPDWPTQAAFPQPLSNDTGLRKCPFYAGF
jgi:hypothetical protein